MHHLAPPQALGEAPALCSHGCLFCKICKETLTATGKNASVCSYCPPCPWAVCTFCDPAEGSQVGSAPLRGTVKLLWRTSFQECWHQPNQFSWCWPRGCGTAEGWPVPPQARRCTGATMRKCEESFQDLWLGSGANLIEVFGDLTTALQFCVPHSKPGS